MGTKKAHSGAGIPARAPESLLPSPLLGPVCEECRKPIHFTFHKWLSDDGNGLCFGVTVHHPRRIRRAQD